MPDAFIETAYFKDLMNRAVLYLQAGYAVHFCGPAGTGKTALAMHIAELLGRPVVTLQGNDEYKPSDLVGGNSGMRRRKVLDNYVHSVWKAEEAMDSVWYDGRITHACRNGYTLVYDDFTRSKPETNNVLLAVLQERTLDLSTLQKGETKLSVHPDFSVIFTSNPSEYAGVHILQDALKDRVITIPIRGLDRESEVAIVSGRSGLPWREAARIVDIIRGIRRNSVKKPSIRASIMVATILATRGFKPLSENPVFLQVLMDVIGSEIFYESDDVSNNQLLERIRTELEKYISEDRK
ncbi:MULTISPECIES: gas vesicle protein GvpN [Desulfosporosinus]|uniref:Denitrification regulatory protein NirQ n=1 Tax=Desulfosporosinus acididurans TaxID=476652 RepID=A0A0J1FX61_9FIRM|nr:MULTISPECIES: gas vesicle protein GvpN [Desulfosporosinus]KLU67578.1 denitrification regulatory protein NirQ [Desulfosporosinus acididurans]